MAQFIKSLLLTRCYLSNRLTKHKTFFVSVQFLLITFSLKKERIKVPSRKLA